MSAATAFTCGLLVGIETARRDWGGVDELREDVVVCSAAPLVARVCVVVVDGWRCSSALTAEGSRPVFRMENWTSMSPRGSAPPCAAKPSPARTVLAQRV